MRKESPPPPSVSFRKAASKMKSRTLVRFEYGLPSNMDAMQSRKEATGRSPQSRIEANRVSFISRDPACEVTFPGLTTLTTGTSVTVPLPSDEAGAAAQGTPLRKSLSLTSIPSVPSRSSLRLRTDLSCASGRA